MSEKVLREKDEIRIEGKPISPGIVTGKACTIKYQKPIVEPRKVSEDEAENGFKQFLKARDAIASDLEELSSMAQKADLKEILQAQIEFARDPEIEFQIKELVYGQQYCIDYAVYEAYRNFIELIQSTKNEILIERISDIAEIRDQLIRLIRKSTKEASIDNNVVLVTNELAASELIRFAENNLLGLILDGGGETSHTSIIARSLGIPTIINTEYASKVIKTGQTLIVDGFKGLLIGNPREQTKKTYKERLQTEKKEQVKLQKVLEKSSVTKSGSSFTLCANLEFENELPNITTYKADGIGLLRTESLYLTRGHFEDRDTQEQFYDRVVSYCNGLPVTIRLFDAGGDKFIDDDIHEHNPFLGWRGIRILLGERKLLRDQLTAILTVAGRNPGQVRILIPMIGSMEELFAVKEEISAIQDQLENRGQPVDNEVPLGIMVEVPSVAVMAVDYVPHVDFFSIGTNDLTQYSLAVDRGNKLVTHLYNQTHPVVWRMIEMVVEAAGNEKIPVTVCGELASNPAAAACLLGLGISDLSMAPVHIPRVKKLLINHSLKEMQDLSGCILKATTQEQVNKLLNEWNAKDL